MRHNAILSTVLVTLLSAVLLQSCKKEPILSDIAPYGKDQSQAQIVSFTSVNNNLTLEDRVSGVDYIITQNIEVNALLTIQPGVTIMFADGAGIIVNEQGSLLAEGTAAKQIRFTSKSGKRGAWKGITILSNSSKNVLSYCKIEHGGGNNTMGTGNIIVGSGTNTAQAEINYCEITAAFADGVQLSKHSTLNHFTNNKIHTNSVYGLNLYKVDAFSIHPTNEFSNNGSSAIHYIENQGGLAHHSTDTEETE
ncbi:MAG: hypothetical protein KIS94_15875 [Chitinophagales bacterium]|nr:hypothetical protein [Chitinophagales bacterium]